MRIAIVTLTKTGKETGAKVRAALKEHEIELYANKKFVGKDAKPLKEPFVNFVGMLFKKFDALIFVCAVGIVARALAKHIRGKARDPAVLVLDERGRFVISFLSGHLGGANELARQVAERIGSLAVVTTATDVQGKPCVEDIAKKYGFEIEDLKSIKKINAAIVNGERVGIFSDIPVDLELPENARFFNLTQLKQKQKNYDALILITNKRLKLKKPCTFLRPKNLVIGVGARKGTGKNAVLRAIKAALSKAMLSEKSLRAIATADFKARERGIVEAAKELNVHLLAIEKWRIKSVEKKFARSEFVQRSVGVGAVSEPCAVLAGRNAKLLQKRIKFNGVTAAIAEERIK